MASRNPGNSIVEYSICGILIAVVTISALAGLGKAVHLTIQGVGTELGALVTGQASSPSQSSKAPTAILSQHDQHQTGSSGSTKEPSTFKSGASDPVEAPNTPAVQVSGSNGSSDKVPSSPKPTASQPAPTAPGGDSSSSPEEGGIPMLIPPISKALINP